MKLATLGKSGQCATVSTHCSEMRLPPQKCLARYCSEASQGKEPRGASWPSYTLALASCPPRPRNLDSQKVAFE